MKSKSVTNLAEAAADPPINGEYNDNNDIIIMV